MHLWRWFIPNFLIVFVMFGFAVDTHLYDGHGVTKMKVWRLYQIEMPKAFSPQPLGPASGNSPLAAVLSTHVAVATLAGLVSMGVGWYLGRQPKPLT
jgi:hypothetical protein